MYIWYHLVDRRSEHTTDVGEDSEFLKWTRKMSTKQTRQMQEDILTSDDIDDRPVGRTWSTDTRQRPCSVNNTGRFIVRLLEDSNQQVHEAEKAFFRC